MQFVLEPGPAAILFWIVTLGWLSEALWLPSRRGAETDPDGASERRAIVAAIMGGLLWTALCHGLGWGNLEGRASAVMRTCGLALYTSGLVLRYWSALVLGRRFTRDVHVGHDQALACSGPYRLLRHPLYVGLLCLGTGLLLLFANLAGPALGFPMLAIAIRRRVRREERLLRSTLEAGSYERWCRHRLRLIPGFF
ncbi:MAG: isoprenylcysteine carboxylmethyltransferase family protein [Thermoanaerobaculia bacterium]|nr:isoprenylcysteine carboxylmethyltransferase family protein [Thermoanaerobaculia bacterium]